MMPRAASIIRLFVLMVATSLAPCALPRAGAEPPRTQTVSLPEPTSDDTLRRVAAPKAGVAAVSVPGRVLVIGHNGKHDRQYLSVFRLDKQGDPVDTEPAHVSLPKPKPLKDVHLITLEITAHPDKPLLYVWQDRDATQDYSDKQKAATRKHLNHLLVYRVNGKGGLELLQQTARGERVGDGHQVAPLTLDVARERLYVPNIRKRRPGDDNLRPQAGYVALNDDGTVPAKNGVPRMTGQVGHAVLSGEYGWPFEYVPLNGELVLLGVHHSLVTWDPRSEQTRFARFALYGMHELIHIAKHPKLPAVYAVSHRKGRVHRVRLANGYSTLLPQWVRLPHRDFRSEPIVLADRRQIAVGERGRIVLLSIDKQGWLTGEVERLELNTFRGTAMAYAPAFDRLYAAVKSVPEQDEQ